nr:hypothetical protein [Vulcanisaeta sp. JCM 16159]
MASVNLDFGNMPYEGLKAYEGGFVKEGVGAGGVSIAAISRGYSISQLQGVILSDYEELLRSMGNTT